MAHSHCSEPGQGPENNGFLYHDMYCTHYTGIGTGNPIVPFLVPVPVSVPCSVYEQLLGICSLIF